VAHAWETGVGFPTAAKTFHVAERVGVDPHRAVLNCFGQNRTALAKLNLTQKEGVAALLSEFRGKQTVVALAKAMNQDRFAVSRWLRGKSEPRLPEFLRFVETATLRLADFLSQLVDPNELAETKSLWQKLETIRRATRDAPYCHAVLTALDLTDYRALCKHQPGYIAARLGLTIAEEEQAISLLSASGQIRRYRQRWVPARTATVDTRSDPEGTRSLATYCAEQGLAKLKNREVGAFAFNLFSVSNGDFERLKVLQREYFAELRQIVAASKGTEQVVIVNLQLFSLSENGKPTPKVE
jgi:DNA-binding phage protein